MSQVIPIFRIFDEAKAKTFYVDYLGFEISFVHRFEQNAPLYLGVNRGQCDIHLSEHYGDATPGSSVRVFEEHLIEYHEQLTLKDNPYYRPSITHQPWGALEMTVLDPFSNKLIFYRDA